VAAHLEPALFRDPVQRGAFVALLESDDLHRAIEAAPPEVGALLVRLTVEEPKSDAEEVVVQLVRDAARHELPFLATEARTSPEAMTEAAEVARWVQELDDPATATAARTGLVAWLAVRSESGGAGQVER
jgi:hypothetical protein